MHRHGQMGRLGPGNGAFKNTEMGHRNYSNGPDPLFCHNPIHNAKMPKIKNDANMPKNIYIFPLGIICNFKKKNYL